MVPREITPELVAAFQEYPVATVFGPRQSGKTTLVRMTYPSRPYISLEYPDVRSAAQADPRAFFRDLPEGAILDEIQRLPELLSYLQGIVDEQRRPGQFLLTGSQQPDVHQAVSQTLAGRTALLTLLPFSLSELRHDRTTREDPWELTVQGAFPRVHREGLSVGRFYNGYVQTYVERDVRTLLNVKDLHQFQQFLTLLAGRIGQVVNYASLGNDVGLSTPSVKSWIGVLKASFLVFELPPFFENIQKRVVKSPKLYFTDTGLASYLLGIETPEQAARDPLRGGLYENLVILEILKAFYNRGRRPQLTFFRDTHGNEVDLLVRRQRTLVPVEIKSSQTFSKEFLKGIRRFRALSRDCAPDGFVLYDGRETFHIEGVTVQNPLRDGIDALLPDPRS
jgi:hypothetical protein